MSASGYPTRTTDPCAYPNYSLIPTCNFTVHVFREFSQKYLCRSGFRRTESYWLRPIAKFPVYIPVGREKGARSRVLC
jgi:hypothetical protein